MTPFYTTDFPNSTGPGFGCFPKKPEYSFRKIHGQMAFPADVTLEMCLEGNSVNFPESYFYLIQFEILHNVIKFINAYYITMVKFINTCYITVQCNFIDTEYFMFLFYFLEGKNGMQQSIKVKNLEEQYFIYNTLSIFFSLVHLE